MLRLFLIFALLAQSSYYGPKPPPHFGPPSIENTIRVQIQIYDDPALGGARIEEVSFNQQDIPLQSPDLHGFRGGAGFQMSPGKYDLVWSVSTDRTSSPKTVQQKQKISISKGDQWIQITIQGENATVT